MKNMPLKTFKILLLFVLCFLLTSCFRLNKMYAYKEVSSRYDWGLIGAKLIGSFETTADDVTISGSPYELLIWFDSVTDAPQKVIVEEVKLVATTSNEVVFQKNEIIEKMFAVDNEQRSAYFSYPKLKFDYNQYQLIITFSIETDGKTTQHQSEMIFKKAYKEFRSNDLFDKIMSV